MEIKFKDLSSCNEKLRQENETLKKTVQTLYNEVSLGFVLVLVLNFACCQLYFLLPSLSHACTPYVFMCFFIGRGSPPDPSSHKSHPSNERTCYLQQNIQNLVSTSCRLKHIIFYVPHVSLTRQVPGKAITTVTKYHYSLSVKQSLCVLHLNCNPKLADDTKLNT